jgi:hypothetical protein
MQSKSSELSKEGTYEDILEWNEINENFKVDENDIWHVEEFTYLGNVVTKDGRAS